MNNAFDNFIKGPLTSLMGLALMCAAGYGWYIDYLTDWQGGGAGIVGFALLFMRDRLPEFISRFFNALIEKFSGNKNKLPLLLLFASVSAIAQVNTNTRQIRFFPITTAGDTAASASLDGRIWYDFSTDEFRGIRNGVPFSFASGSGEATTASNGLTEVGNDVRLGGALTQTTEITSTTFDFNFTATGPVNSIFQTSFGTSGQYGFGMDNTGSIFMSTDQDGGTGKSCDFLIFPTGDMEIDIQGGTGDFTTAAVGTGFRNVTWGGSSSGNFTVQGFNNINLTNKTFFTPTSTLAGLNTGSLAGNPSTPANGDLWYNSVNNRLQSHISNSTVHIPYFASSLASNNIVYRVSGTGQLSEDSDLTFTGGNTLNTANLNATGRGTFTSTTTLPGINVGAFAGDPSSPVNGDMSYNSANGRFRITTSTGTNQTLLYTGNTGTVANRIYYGSNTTGSLGSEDVFAYDASTDILTVDEINLGHSSNAETTKTLSVIGSATDIFLALRSKGSFPVRLLNGTTNNALDYYASTNSLESALVGTGATTFTIKSDDGIVGQETGQHLNLTAGSGYTTGNNDGGDVIITAGAANGTGIAGDITHESPTILKGSSTEAALTLNPIAGNPSSPNNGDLHYNSTTSQYVARKNGVTENIITGNLATANFLTYSNSTEGITTNANFRISTATDYYLAVGQIAQYDEAFNANQSNLDNATLRYANSGESGDDPEVVIYQQYATTGGSTPTTIKTITIPASTTVGLEVTVVARRTGGSAGTAEDGAMYKIMGVFKNVAGTATQIGATGVVFSAEDQAGWDVTFSPSGADVNIQVTGATNNNISWELSECKYMRVSN